MTTTSQTKIEVLTKEREENFEKIRKFHCQIEDLMKEVVRYESGKTQRNAELVEYEGKLASLREKIADFNQETYELYSEYHKIMDEYKKCSEFYSDIDERIAKRKAEISTKKELLKDYEQRVMYLEEELKKAHSEEK